MNFAIKAMAYTFRSERAAAYTKKVSLDSTISTASPTAIPDPGSRRAVCTWWLFGLADQIITPTTLHRNLLWDCVLAQHNRYLLWIPCCCAFWLHCGRDLHMGLGVLPPVPPWDPVRTALQRRARFSLPVGVLACLCLWTHASMCVLWCLLWCRLAPVPL